MSDDGDGALLQQLVGDLGSSLESSVFSAVTDPVIGWVAALFDLGGGGDGLDGELSKLQTGLSQILSDISGLQKTLENVMNAISASAAIAPAVTAVQDYQNSVLPPSTQKTMSLPVDWLVNPATAGLLTTVHDTLIGFAVGSTPYLTSCRSMLVPRYTADASPNNQQLQNFFIFHEKLQAALMQMSVEAAHQGQTVNTQAVATDHSGSLAPNYVAAAQAYAQYASQIAQQSTFLPFPTSAAGFKNFGLFGSGGNFGGSSFGASSIVFDQTTGFAWASQNNAAGSSATTVPNLQSQLNIPVAWMMRAPTYAELDALHASLTPPGSTLSAAEMLTAMQEVGFNLSSDPTASCPFATAEVFDRTNWTLINPVWFKHRPPGSMVIASGYQCDKFYDPLNGVPVNVQINFDVTEDVYTGTNGFGVTSGLEFFNTVPPNIQVTSVSSAGTLSLNFAEYTDALFIYQLAAADAGTFVNTDPPLEEPSSLLINQVTNADGSVSCTATASFNRLYRSGARVPPVTLEVPNVYWTVSPPNVATISQSGLLTWLSGGSPVTVTAVRGNVTGSAAIAAPSNFTPRPAPSPSRVNIYPRNVELDSSALPANVAFSGQILYSDGSTSPAADGRADDTQFQWSANENIQLSPGTPRIDSTSHDLVQATFVIPAGTTQTVTVAMTLNNNSQLHDSATITIT